MSHLGSRKAQVQGMCGWCSTDPFNPNPTFWDFRFSKNLRPRNSQIKLKITNTALHGEMLQIFKMKTSSKFFIFSILSHDSKIRHRVCDKTRRKWFKLTRHNLWKINMNKIINLNKNPMKQSEPNRQDYQKYHKAWHKRQGRLNKTQTRQHNRRGQHHYKKLEIAVEYS